MPFPTPTSIFRVTFTLHDAGVYGGVHVTSTKTLTAYFDSFLAADAWTGLTGCSPIGKTIEEVFATTPAAGA